MVFAVISIPSSEDLKTKLIKVSGPDDLSKYLLKTFRDKVNKNAAYLKDGNRLSLNNAEVDTHIVLAYVEEGGYELQHVSTDKEKTLYVFKRKE